MSICPPKSSPNPNTAKKELPRPRATMLTRAQQQVNDLRAIAQRIQWIKSTLDGLQVGVHLSNGATKLIADIYMDLESIQNEVLVMTAGGGDAGTVSA